MNWTVGVNLVANCVLTVSFGAFLIFLFGRENSLIHKMKSFNVAFVKVAMGVCASGALYNVLTLSEPPISEVVMNTGLAMLFLWAAWFHYCKFVKPLKEKPAEKTGKRRGKKAVKGKIRNYAEKG
jgi:hypothetical protein